MAVVRKKSLPVATPEDFEGVTLMRMRSENIMRVRLVDISPTETLTLIGGENANGKTAFLDSLAICLGGKEAIPADPIHHGKQVGTITCDFGDGQKVKLTVHCTIKKVGDEDWVSEVELDIPGHVPPSAVQTFLKKLIGKPSFDPMVFDALPPAEQFETMQAFVAGFDFKKHAADYKKKYDARRDVGRDQAREQSAADSIVYAAEAPCERIDEEQLAEELRLAGETNVALERRRSNRQKAVETIDAVRDIQARTVDAIAAVRVNAEAARDKELARLQEQVDALLRQMKEVGEECEASVAREADRLRKEQAAAEASAAQLQAKLDAAGPLEELVDTAAISARMKEARESNQKREEWESARKRHADHQMKADDFATQYGDLTKELDDMDAAKEKAIREAEMPVPGLGFGDGFVTLPAQDRKPVPWTQASMAERVDASCSIAMAMNPKIKVILIRNGSNLGKAIRARIRQRAAEKKYRVLMEVVEEGGGTHVVIEDGVVRGAA